MFKPRNPREERLYKTCIPKHELQDNVYYTGECRNSSIAKWNKERDTFTYTRYKFGDTFIEEIQHPDDSKGDFDVFFPQKQAELNE